MPKDLATKEEKSGILAVERVGTCWSDLRRRKRSLMKQWQ